MRAFSQLLDDLVYTRSRNTKLRLTGTYLKEMPDPDRAMGSRSLTGTLDIPTGETRGDRGVGRRADRSCCCSLMSRDYVGDTAETVALLWPKSSTSRPKWTMPSFAFRTRSSGSGRPLRLDAPHVLARMLDHLDASGRFALLKLASRRASCRHQRAPGQDKPWPMRSAWKSKRWKRSGTGCVRRSPSCSHGPKGRRRAADRPRHPGVPAIHARPPAGRQPRSRSTNMRRN